MGRDEARDAELREVLARMQRATDTPLRMERWSVDAEESLLTFGQSGVREGDFSYSLWCGIKEADALALAAAWNFLRKHGESLASRPQAGTVETGCPACGRNWGEHRSGYSASRCPMKKPPTPPGDSEDAARLDWLESQFGDGVHVEGCHSGAWSERNLARCATVFYGNKEARATTIREAIDAARAAQEANNG